MRRIGRGQRGSRGAAGGDHQKRHRIEWSELRTTLDRPRSTKSFPLLLTGIKAYPSASAYFFFFVSILLFYHGIKISTHSKYQWKQLLNALENQVAAGEHDQSKLGSLSQSLPLHFRGTRRRRGNAGSRLHLQNTIR